MGYGGLHHLLCHALITPLIIVNALDGTGFGGTVFSSSPQASTLWRRIEPKVKGLWNLEELSPPSPSLSPPPHLHFSSSTRIPSTFVTKTSLLCDLNLAQASLTHILITAGKGTNDLRKAREKHVKEHSLKVPFRTLPKPSNSKPTVVSLVKIDASDEDVSEIIVIDSLIPPSLRGSLLSLISPPSPHPRSVSPDPRHFVRGGFDDVSGVKSTCFGLRDSGYDRLLNDNTGVIEELEGRVVEWIKGCNVGGVGLMPWCVYGDDVAIIGANAPVKGDEEPGWHIDADPSLIPSSAFVDCYGRFRNREVGKPRFMTLLVYLNEIWEEGWGAGTEFKDSTVEEDGGEGEVFATVVKPGRCVLLDGDVVHRVTNPTVEDKVRYSLAVKMILWDWEDVDWGVEGDKIRRVGSAKRNHGGQ